MILLLLLSVPFLSISEQPLSREIIAYDPAQMPLLMKEYETFKTELPSDPQELLMNVAKFVRLQLFDLKLCNESMVRSVVGENRLMPLDAFVEAKTGVCRHFALATGYFIERLLDDGYLHGEHRWVRAAVPGHGRHAWNLLQSEKNCWLIDSYWGVVGNLNDPTQYEKLTSLYGNLYY